MASVEKSWVADYDSQVKNVNPSDELERWRKQSIYRVPACIKDLNIKAYKPQVVSFGPFHHGEAQVMPMEEHKHRALLHFLKRSMKPSQDFVTEMEEVVEQLQDAYHNLDEDWRRARQKFLQLMIVDGCFMLEIIRVSTGRPNDYTFNDPIFSSHGVLYTVPYIRRDMLMIENQLPLLVLEKLVAVETGKSRIDDQINKRVLRFYAPILTPLPVGPGLHPLDLFRRSLFRGRFPTRSEVGSSEIIRSAVGSSEIIRSAVELYEAGIRFKRSKTGSLRDISFSHGVLSLPVIVVDDTTEFMFLNLMAFERLHVGAGNEVTSYVFFMDNIVDSAKDVSLLHSGGIIQNAIGSDEAVANLFNSLSKDVVLDPESSLDHVHQAVNHYCRNRWKMRWNMWRANLIQTYFMSPWTVLSLAAAIFLLLNTVAQTLYSVLSYYQQAESGGSPPSPPEIAPPPFHSPD